MFITPLDLFIAVKNNERRRSSIETPFGIKQSSARCLRECDWMGLFYNTRFVVLLEETQQT